MKLHSFSLFIKEAFNNIFLNKAMSLATVATLTAGLFLFGITSALALNIFSITEKLEKDFKLAVYLEEELETEEKNKIGIKIQELSNVESIDFVSGEDAYDSLKEQWGDTEILEGIDDGSILRDSYKITLSDLSQSGEVVKKLEKIDGIAKISRLEDEMSTFVSITKKVQTGTIIITVILALLAVLIMTNTISLSISARDKQIRIMKYVGATDWYIRWPFIIEGMLIGLFSSAFSCVILKYIYSYLLKSFGSYSELIGVLPLNAAMPPVTAIVIGIGVILGCIASMFSIKNSLKV